MADWLKSNKSYVVGVVAALGAGVCWLCGGMDGAKAWGIAAPFLGAAVRHFFNE